MSRVERTLFHTAVYGLGMVLNRGVVLLLLPLYAHLLSPAEVALWDLCSVTVLFLVPILQMGMSSALLRAYNDTDDEAERVRSIATIFYFSCAVWVLAGIALIRFAEPIAGWILEDRAHEGLMILVVLLAIATTLGNQPLAILRATEQSLTFSIINLFRSIAGPLAIVLLVVVYRRGVEGILLGELLGLVVLAAAGILVHPRYAMPHFDLPALKRALAYGLPLIPMAMAASITMMSDRYFLVHTIGSAEMATYSMAFRVAMVMAVIVRAFQTSWPASALILAKESDAAITTAKFFRWFISAMLLMAVAIAAGSREIIALITPGDTYLGAHLIVPWVVLSYAIYAGVFFVLSATLVTRNTFYAMLIYVGGAALKIGLNTIFIDLFLRLSGGDSVWAGAGASIATVIVYMVELAAAIWIGQKIYPVPYDIQRIAFTIAASIAAMTGIVALSGMPLALGIAGRAAIVLAFAGCIFAARMIPAAERRDVAETIKRRWEGLSKRFRRTKQ